MAELDTVEAPAGVPPTRKQTYRHPETGEEISRRQWDKLRNAFGFKAKPRKAPGRSSAPPKAATPDGDVSPSQFERPKAGSLKKQIGVLVSGLNDVLIALPFSRNDALTVDEGSRLVDALDQAQQSNARIKRFLVKSTEGAGILPLVFVGATIVLSRLIRHGVVPMPGNPEDQLTPEQKAALQAFHEATAAAGAGAPVGMNGAAPQPQTPLGVG